MELQSREFTILLMVSLGIFIYINFLRKSLHLELIESNTYNKEYYVRKLPDKQQAADKLGSLSIKLNNLIKHCADKDNKVEEINKLSNNFNSEIITENIPGSRFVAYSVNKGDELSICIRNKNTEDFIEDNTVIFVAIHELAHIMTEESGHPPEFWDNMKYLLENAEEIGIYNPINYSKNPVDYCGQKIDSTPMDL